MDRVILTLSPWRGNVPHTFRQKERQLFDDTRQWKGDAPPGQPRDLYTWTITWYDKAVELGFIEPPFEPDDFYAWRLQGYFDARLTPSEAVQALFGCKH